MKLSEIESASKSNPSLRRILQMIETWGTGMEDHLGFNPQAGSQAKNKRVGPPMLANMTIEGVDGHFSIQITNPVGAAGQILHEIKGSPTVPIVKSTDLIVRGPSSDLQYDIIDPGVSRYFQLRSKYAYSDFNQPQVFPSVSSGVLRSGSNSNKNITFTPTDPDPVLYQLNQLAVIVVNPTTFDFGSDLRVSYNGASLTMDDQGDPLTFSTYYVYGDDPTRAGGTIDLLATQDPSVLTANDGRVAFGVITLSEQGGGIIFPPGSAGGTIEGTVITLLDGTTQLVEQLVAGDVLQGPDGAAETLSSSPIVLASVPCFTITTSTGKFITLSSDQYLQSGPGGRLPVSELVANDSINTDIGSETISSVVYTGLLTVYHLPLSRTRFYLAGSIWSG